MKNGKYSLRYISKYEEDLNKIVDYLTFKLRNPDSAIKLINKIEKAIFERLNCPVSFEQFLSNRKRMYPYYRIYVDNFTVYYVVIDNIMEVRRIFYNGRDAVKIIK